MKPIYLSLFLLIISVNLLSQDLKKDSTVKEAPKPRTEWYKKISIRGYTQIRYNRFLETNENLQCEQCDRSWGGNGGFFLRRIRIIFYGQVHERVYFYI